MITVLRIGHRPERDKRITTHVALVARAFGADKIIVDKDDEKLKNTVERVTQKFGGNFTIEFNDWRKYLKDYNGKVVHLTMYGIPYEKKIRELKKEKDILIIVGAEKVPREVYERADYNLAVRNQPHSEVSALAIFLKDLIPEKKFYGELRIIPQEKGKKVLRIPSREECISLLKKYGADERLLKHSIKCSEVALKMSENCNVDKMLIEAGALLHDIGKTVVKGIRHGVEGYYILKNEGYDEILARFCSTHVGAGIRKSEAKKLGLPDMDYIPRTLEEKIVCHADTLLAGDRITDIEEVKKYYIEQGLEREVPRLERLHYYLQKKCKKDFMELLLLNK